MLNCFSTLGCAELDFDAVVHLAQSRGISSVELRALGGTIDLPAYFNAHFGAPDKLAARLSGCRVRVVALDTSLKLNGSSETEWRDTTEAFMPWTEALGGVNLRVFDGGKTHDATAIALMADRVQWWAELRQQRGWRSDLMIETHDSLFTGAAIRALLTAAPSARILWDSHHTWKRGGEDPLVTWQAIASSVVHVHVKDSISVPSARHPFTYVLPGAGEFPARTLLPVLRAEFKGAVSLEWEKLWHPYLPPLDEALQAAGASGW